MLGPAHGKLAPAAGVPAPPDPPVAAAPVVPSSEPHPTALTKPKNRTIASLPEAIERISKGSAACVPRVCGRRAGRIHVEGQNRPVPEFELGFRARESLRAPVLDLDLPREARRAQARARQIIRMLLSGARAAPHASRPSARQAPQPHLLVRAERRTPRAQARAKQLSRMPGTKTSEKSWETRSRSSKKRRPKYKGWPNQAHAISHHGGEATHLRSPLGPKTKGQPARTDQPQLNSKSEARLTYCEAASWLL